ncbi:hypothetical protein A3A14_03415 [Candidatus Daviesbacteria bacterium RIFCSPLOWO2_01_FULL_43_38]|uniref:Uncharacterized protein n=3 Tax=Candidatus Daviesiibacteriota TaxID=1752718 RepID=A0A1F5K769_9BACT|nr:MAG: hypothetical protein UV33_C0001G0011 [Candidatus Daviesbacteria bacterium GW2011_GWA1_42_6]OGE20628.1 MAG: hypothetical protein A2874_02040 [Candidatus Daviesbacteria bacterium RIFCSPHIGHO2_01_FULL_43_17]OGE36772.1 MAG: hypothetical protein A3E45_01460 [Candidatus Daviesbacteria bacterium RIFCSPHIGHO2_12_FULL_43_11]OGE63690.1 MAG: hypothetical protein A3A14_03415 [Candidatus Daviesbacteria bacterium RIFCSPLOWO2_01_FULL_43_38]
MIEAPRETVYYIGRRRWIVGGSGSGKSVVAGQNIIRQDAVGPIDESDFEVWNSLEGMKHFDEVSKRRIVPGLKESDQGKILKGVLEKLGYSYRPLQLPFEDCLMEVRGRAVVMGMDYDEQSMDYILGAASHLMVACVNWVEEKVPPFWDLTLQTPSVPNPVRDYGGTTLEQVIKASQKAKKAIRIDGYTHKKVVDEVIAMTPDALLYEKAVTERQEREAINLENLNPKGREEILFLRRSMSPTTVMARTRRMTLDLIDKLVRDGKLRSVQKDFRDDPEREYQSIRNLYDWYCKRLFGNFKDRYLVVENKLLPPPIHTYSRATLAKYSLPIAEIAIDTFGKIGLGAFLRKGNPVKYEPLGVEKFLVTLQPTRPRRHDLPNKHFHAGVPFSRDEERLDPDVAKVCVQIATMIVKLGTPYYKGKKEEIVLDLSEIAPLKKDRSNSIYATGIDEEALEELEKEGLIKIEGDRLIIPDFGKIWDITGLDTPKLS